MQKVIVFDFGIDTQVIHTACNELDGYSARPFEQTDEHNGEHSCWQYFIVLLDIKNAKVIGDEPTYAR